MFPKVLTKQTSIFWQPFEFCLPYAGPQLQTLLDQHSLFLNLQKHFLLFTSKNVCLAHVYVINKPTNFELDRENFYCLSNKACSFGQGLTFTAEYLTYLFSTQKMFYNSNFFLLYYTIHILQTKVYKMMFRLIKNKKSIKIPLCLPTDHAPAPPSQYQFNEESCKKYGTIVFAKSMTVKCQNTEKRSLF